MSDHLENPVESDRLQNVSSPVFSANLPFLVLVSVPGSSWHGMTLCEIHLFGARLVTNYERGGLVSHCGLHCGGTNLHLPTRPKEKAPGKHFNMPSPQPSTKFVLRQIWSQLLPTLNSPVISAKQKMRAAENEGFERSKHWGKERI